MPATPLQIETESSGPFAGICTIWLEQPDRPVVVLDETLIQRLEATLGALPPHCRGLVVASASERVFVAGADLKAISELDDGALDRYLAYGQGVFGALSQVPFPTAAAIGGAALGGGLELAMHCDGLIGAPSASGKPYPVGLPEAGLSICPGWGGTNLLAGRINPEEGIRRTAEGKPLIYDEAVEAGLFDSVAGSPDELLATARRWIADRVGQGPVERDGAPSRWIGREGVRPVALRALETCRERLGDSPPVRAVLEAVDRGLNRGWQAALDCERERLVSLRGSEAGRAAIEAFFARSASKGSARQA
jgi:enoyl-CoA hydratase/carnithine racemase